MTRRIVVSIPLGMLLVAFAAAGSQPSPKKLPLPQSKDLDRATALVKELYREELAKADKEPDARLRLAQTLLVEARDTTDDPAGKYTLLGLAAGLAADAGDVATALEALDQLTVSFDIPASAVLSLKTHALRTAAQATGVPIAYQSIVDAAQALMEETITTADFDSALALGQAAENAAKKLKSVALVSSIRKRVDGVKALQAEYAQVQPFIETLKKDPKNAKANFETGRYFALARGNWNKGLPLLAKGSDPALAELAALDLKGPEDGAKVAQLAVQWAKLADGLQAQSRVHALLRSLHWYQRALALANLGDKERAAVEAAMLTVNDRLPPEHRAGEITGELRRATGHDGPVFGVAISADGGKIASAGADGSVRLWDAQTLKPLRRFDGHGSPVWTVQFSPDGRHILSGGFDKSIRLWDPVSGRESKRLGSHDDYVRSVCFSANGLLVLSGGDDRLVRLWDAVSGSELKTLPGHDHFVFGVAMSRDGKRGLSASLDRTVRLWDLETGSILHTLTGHTDTVLSVVFTPDGKRALSASTDKTLRLWDLGTGQCLNIFKGHAGFVYSVAVSPDGRRASQPVRTAR